MSKDYNWLKKHVDPILDISDSIKSIRQETYNEFGPWAVIKLVALKYFMNVYTPIISAQKWVNKMRYIELFAGSGLCKIKSTNDLIAGSPILAATLAKKPFDELLLVEMNREYCRALEERMNVITPIFQIFENDCNKAINDIDDILSFSDHYLAFIDCQKGMEVKWSTMSRLLSKPGDIIFNFQSVQIFRAVRQGQEKPSTNPILNEFYGDDRWKKYHSREECLQGYIERLKEASSREIVIPCMIRGPKSFYYDLIIAAKKTGGGNPWMGAVRDLQIRTKRLKPSIMTDVLDILKGRKTTLDKFFT